MPYDQLFICRDILPYYMAQFILLFVRKITHADWVIAERLVLA